METESLQTDDCFQERLIYSDSENSDTEETINQASKAPTKQISEDCLSATSKEPTEPEHSDQNNLSNDSDEGDFNKSLKTVKRNARILCSDDDDDENDKRNESNEPPINQNEIETQFEEVDQNTTDQINIRPSICDSDTKSSSDGNQSDTEKVPTKTIKKLKKKMKKKITKKSEPSRKRVITNQSDSESNDENTDKPDKKQKKSTKKQKNTSDHSNSGSSSGSSDSGSGSNTASDSNASTNDNETPNVSNNVVKPREKTTAQRMSAKVAEQQMKEIQSESQRMARQLPVTVPYHKPKQHSLKEFLSRRSIVQQQERLKSKPLPNAAIGIKMSKDELAKFIDEMERRTQEAEEFFQEQEEESHSAALIKSDDSDDDDWTDKSAAKELKPAPPAQEEQMEIEEADTQMNECQDTETLPLANSPIQANGSEAVVECTDATDVLEIDNENKTDNQTSTTEQPIESEDLLPAHAANIIEFHTERTELDDELDAMLAGDHPKPSISTDFVPKLKGGDGLVIDLETNDLKQPTSQDGVQELFSRFIKNACVKKNATLETQNVGIFQSNTGTVEQHVFHVNLDDKPKAEAKPGESLLKLQSELGKKIKENRKKLIAQRLQEKREQELAQKEMESEGDEEEICDEEGEEDNGDDDVQSKSERDVAVSNSNEMVEMEAIDSEQNEDSENETENSDQSDSESLTVDLDVNTDATAKPRKRIISMNDESDDERSQPNISKDAPAAMESDNQTAEKLSESIEIQATNLTLDDSFKTMNSHDLSALESEILQLDSEMGAGLNKSDTSKLFQNSNEDEEIGESQLMALCSGAFETQYPQSVPQLTEQNADQPTQNGKSTEVSTQQNEIKETSPPNKQSLEAKSAFLSSDDEEIDNKDAPTATDKVKKKRKKQALIYSDDEEDNENAAELETADDETVEEEENIGEEEDEEKQEQIDDEEEDMGERYIEYDSDENEIEVELKKSDIRRKASDFFENEAELSGSELGSDDEDEKDEMNNHYESELGDADKFDKNKLRDELERIRLREQIDQDARELRILTERFVEEEDNGQERERKFRWKHLNNGDMDDVQQNTDQDATAVLNNSDDENEAEWRRIRYEREQLLKQQIKDNSVVERTSVALEVTDEKTAENVTVVTTSTSCIKRISFTKPVATVPKVSSPFLISKNDLSSGHLSRKSFLNRDSPILEKLAGLSKTGSDGETILNTAKGKGNYVFVATEKKDSSKRKSENDMGAAATAESINPSKKSKLELQKTKLRAHTKAFFESLN